MLEEGMRVRVIRYDRLFWALYLQVYCHFVLAKTCGKCNFTLNKQQLYPFTLNLAFGCLIYMDYDAFIYCLNVVLYN